MKTKNMVMLLILIFTICIALVGCDVTNTPSQSNTTNSGEVVVNHDYSEVKQNPVVTMEIENMGIVKIELFPQIAPTTVENFISLVSKGFYNGLTFHRVIPGFMAQGGDPDGNGTGRIGYAISGEFSSNGFENSIPHERGTISMARAQDMDSAGSQFFIVTETSERNTLSLDGNYAAFGKVTEGMDVVDQIVNQEVVRREIDEDITDLNEYIKQSLECDRPINPPVIKTATVETFGVTYSEPVKIAE